MYQLHHNHICQQNDSQLLKFLVSAIKEILLQIYKLLINYAVIAYAGATLYYSKFIYCQSNNLYSAACILFTTGAIFHNVLLTNPGKIYIDP